MNPRRPFWAACLTALSLSLLPLCSQAANPTSTAPATPAATVPTGVQSTSAAATTVKAADLTTVASSDTETREPAAAATPSGKLQKPATPILEPVEVDTRMPVIPLAAARTIDMDNMSLDEAKEALTSLIKAQEKMMTQMQVLQARIEKTEAVTTQNQQAIQANAQQEKNDASLLGALAHRAYLTGYVEQGWRAYNHAPRLEEYLDANGKDGNTFDLRRVVLRPRVNFTDKASWYGELEVEDAFHEVIIEESVFNYAYKPWLNMKSGLMVLPYTYTSANHDGPLRLLVDRPLVDQFVIPSTYQDLGVGVSGMLPVGRRGGFNYEFDMVNGLTDTFAPADDGHRVSSSIDYNGLRDLRPGEGIANEHFRDNNSNKMLFGRLGYSPFPGLQIGVSGSSGKLDQDNRVAANIIASDLQYRYKKFSLMAEYANAMINNRKNGISSQGVSYQLFPAGLNGYFVQLAYDLTPKLTAISAFNHVNLDTDHSGNSMQRISVGMRYNPFNNIYLKTEYQYTTPRGQYGGDERSSNAILTQLTFSFQ